MVNDRRLERIESKLDYLADHLVTMDAIMAKQEVNLQAHMKRSDALEAQIAPIKEHMAMVSTTIKLLKLLPIITPGILWLFHTYVAYMLHNHLK